MLPRVTRTSRGPRRIEVATPWNAVIPITGIVSNLASGGAAPNVLFGCYNGNQAQNDEFGFDLEIPGGRWNFASLFRKGPTDCIVALRIDGVEIAAYDLYAAANAYNQGQFTNNVDIVEGVRRVSFKAKDRNAAAAPNYVFVLQGFALRRTA